MRAKRASHLGESEYTSFRAEVQRYGENAKGAGRGGSLVCSKRGSFF